MNAHDLLHELQCKDITIEVDGSNLIVDGPVETLSDACFVERLRSAKGELLTALLGCSSVWSQLDWQTYFEERAAIREYDGNVSRAEAEHLAYDDAVEHWLCVHPPAHRSPHICVHCGQAKHPADELLSHLIAGPRVSVHEQCWERWTQHRKAQAEEALRTFGLDQKG